MSLFPLVGDIENPIDTISNDTEAPKLAFQGVRSDSALLGVQPSTKHTSKFCETCDKEIWKYRCPGCFRKSCSLSCINHHKKTFGCTGVRQPFEDVPRKELTGEIIAKDYQYLTKVTQFAENSEKSLTSQTASKTRDNNRVKSLRKQCEKLGIKLIQMSKGMSRVNINKSRWFTKDNVSAWTIEWNLFCESGSKFTIVSHYNYGDKILSELLNSKANFDKIKSNSLPDTHNMYNFVESNKESQLFESPLPKLVYLMRVPNVPVSKVVYYRLDPNLSLDKALQKTSFIEFPTIEVYTSIPPNCEIREREDSSFSSSSEEETSSDSSSDSQSDDETPVGEESNLEFKDKSVPLDSSLNPDELTGLDDDNLDSEISVVQDLNDTEDSSSSKNALRKDREGEVTSDNDLPNKRFHPSE